MSVPAWQRRFTAPRVSLPRWALDAPARTTYATNASGVWQIVSWDLDSDRHTVLTDKPTGVLGGAPVADGSGVAWFDDHAGDEVGRWVITPFEGGRDTPLLEEAGEGWSAGLSLRRNRLALGVATRDGFRLWSADDDGARPVYAHRHPADVGGLSRDGELLAISHTEHGDTLHPALRIVDAASGDVLADLSDGPQTTVVPAAWSPVAGDQRLAVLVDASGRMRPQLYDVATGERRDLRLDLPGEVWVAGWWPDASALLLGHDHLGRTRLYRYDVTADESASVDAGDGTVAAAAVRDDGAVWYAFTSSAKPPQIRVRDRLGDRPLLAPGGEPAPEGVAYDTLHYDNGHGDRVHAFVARPRQARHPTPLVVAVHGGPHAQDADAFDPWTQAWVDHGFTVLLANYRGSTGYGKRWQDALDGDPGFPELADLRAGRDHLIGTGVADPARVVLCGASWGGYLTLLGIGTQPNAWTAAVATVPVADYLAAYADESPTFQEFDRSLFGGTPDERPALFRERSPITYVDRVRTPVLVVTGANDTRCPKRQVDNYVAALASKGVPHAYDVYDAGHGSLDVGEVVRQQALALDFVAEHLGTPPAQQDGDVSR